MAGSLTDKFTPTFNAANPNVARVTSTRTAGAGTLACDNLAGWPTSATGKVHFSTYRIDTNNAVVAGTQIDWHGLVSGNNVGSIVRLAGATDAGNAIGDVVEMLPTGSWGQDLFTGLTNEHGPDGTHDATKVAMLAGAQTFTGAKTFTAAPVLPADSIPDASLIYGKIRNRQGGSATDWSVSGTTNYDYSATNTFIQCGTRGGGTGFTITFPTAFNQIPMVFVSVITAGSQNTWARVNAITTTTFTYQVFINNTTTGTNETISWMAIGQ